MLSASLNKIFPSLFSARLQHVLCLLVGQLALIAALKTFYSKTETNNYILNVFIHDIRGARCSSVVRVFAHGAMGRRIDP